MPPDSPFSIVAPAKINLYLHVTGKRDDGYHLLDSLVAFAGIHDTLTFNPGHDLGLEIDGPFAVGLETGPENLVLKAAVALQQLMQVSSGAQLHLTKRLPVASGIGGGSTDAAATLKGLLRLWDIQPDTKDLQALALSLGADVPVCLKGRAAFMGGIGEDISPAPALPACSLVLVNSGIKLSTPAVFKAYSEQAKGFSQSGRFDHTPLDLDELVSVLESGNNDLALAAQQLAPGIVDVLGELERCDGAKMARMSGSGATCFALFTDPGEAAAAALRLSKEHSNWWVRAGSLEGDTTRIP
jgi:4-diphosphocytidyl-2-C-methyl-D-erythritol kinase